MIIYIVKRKKNPLRGYKYYALVLQIDCHNTSCVKSIIDSILHSLTIKHTQTYPVIIVAQINVV